MARPETIHAMHEPPEEGVGMMTGMDTRSKSKKSYPLLNGKTPSRCIAEGKAIKKCESHTTSNLCGTKRFYVVSLRGGTTDTCFAGANRRFAL